MGLLRSLWSRLTSSHVEAGPSTLSEHHTPPSSGDYKALRAMIESGNVSLAHQMFEAARDWEEREWAVVALRAMVQENRPFNREEMAKTLHAIQDSCSRTPSGGSQVASCHELARQMLATLGTTSPERTVPFEVDRERVTSKDRLRFDRGVVLSYDADAATAVESDLDHIMSLIRAQRQSARPESMFSFDVLLITESPSFKTIILLSNGWKHVNPLFDKLYRHNNPGMHGHVELCTKQEAEHYLRGKEGQITREAHL